jgi:hypothetical protein
MPAGDPSPAIVPPVLAVISRSRSRNREAALALLSVPWPALGPLNRAEQPEVPAVSSM